MVVQVRPSILIRHLTWKFLMHFLCLLVLTGLPIAVFLQLSWHSSSLRKIIVAVEPNVTATLGIVGIFLILQRTACAMV